jgi:hypothetical protein
MSDLLLSNFAMHIVLAPEEQEQVLALVQRKSVSKRSILIKPGETERQIYLLIPATCACFTQIKKGRSIICAFIRKTGGLVIL